MLGVKNEINKDYRARTESIKLLFIVGVKNEQEKDYGDRTESINAFFMVLLRSLGQVFASLGQVFVGFCRCVS